MSEDHEHLEEIRQMLWLMVKTGAIDLSPMTSSQKAVIDRFITSWSEEWLRDIKGGIR